MRALMAPRELCMCTLDRNELLERARTGEGVLAVLLPLTGERMGVEPPPLDNEREFAAEAKPMSSERLAERFIRLRRKRDSVFEDRIFADPAWDMMLDLYQASKRSDARPISISSLCIASAVPSTTALRWIEALVQKGLLVRHADERDGRRSFVSLTPEASHKLEEVLSSWQNTE